MCGGGTLTQAVDLMFLQHNGNPVYLIHGCQHHIPLDCETLPSHGQIESNIIYALQSIIQKKHHLMAVAAKPANRSGSNLKGSTKCLKY